MADRLRAMTRFGLGPSAADRRALGDDPRGWVLAQIGRPLRPAGPVATVDAIRVAEIAVRARRRLRRMPEMATDMAGTDAAAMDGGRVDPARPMREPNRLRGLAEREELRLAAETDAPFAERWVRHWSNHFTVRGRGAVGRVLTGPFRAEAIEPHAWGRFADMLLAAALHPAMLIDLDNRLSAGPRSPRGRRTGRGANENLARELMELHTLGSDGGYGQADVSAVALALTGWNLPPTFRREAIHPRAGRTTFRPPFHEPGPRIVMGRRYAEDDGTGSQARAILADLAAHPATARNVGRRLAAHFHGPGPGRAALAATLARGFERSGGELSELATALARHDGPWADDAVLSVPREHAAAWARLLPGALPPQQAIRTLRRMGQPVGTAPSPEGWPEAEGWGAPGELKTRLDLAAALGERAARAHDPLRVAEAAVGPDLSDETRTALRRAASPAQGLAILLMAPEVMLR